MKIKAFSFLLECINVFMFTFITVILITIKLLNAYFFIFAWQNIIDF